MTDKRVEAWEQYNHLHTCPTCRTEWRCNCKAGTTKPGSVKELLCPLCVSEEKGCREPIGFWEYLEQNQKIVASWPGWQRHETEPAQPRDWNEVAESQPVSAWEVYSTQEAGHPVVTCHTKSVGGVLCRWWGDGPEPEGVKLIDAAAQSLSAHTPPATKIGDIIRRLEGEGCVCGAGNDRNQGEMWAFCGIHKLIDELLVEAAQTKEKI